MMSIAAFAIAEPAIAEPAAKPARTPPTRRVAIARPDRTNAVEAR
jgi:hypothetical protein